MQQQQGTFRTGLRPCRRPQALVVRQAAEVLLLAAGLVWPLGPQASLKATIEPEGCLHAHDSQSMHFCPAWTEESRARCV